MHRTSIGGQEKPGHVAGADAMAGLPEHAV
jgi:hypothetical protein